MKELNMKRIVLGLALLIAFAGIAQAQTATPVTSSSPYGTDGSVIPMVNPASVPSYASVNIVNGNEWSWATGHTAWYNGTSFRLVVGILDGNAHRVTLFLQDYDNDGRNEQVVVTTPTGTQLTTNTITNFAKGTYLSWNVTGFVVINVVNNGGINAVASGLYFDPPATGGPALSTVPLLPTRIYSVTISIAPVAGATSYKLYRGTATGGPYPVLVGTTSTLVNGVYMITDTTVVPGTTYYYVTTSVNGGGESGFSQEIQALAP
jgi:hypothetical protein